MKRFSRQRVFVASITTRFSWTFSAPAAPPTEYDVNTYSSLCKIGSAWNLTRLPQLDTKFPNFHVTPNRNYLI